MSPILFLFFSNTLNVNGCEPTWAAMVSCGRRPLEMAETEAGSALCRDWFWKDLDCLTCKLDGVGSIDNRPSNNQLDHFVNFFFKDNIFTYDR